MYSHTCVGMPTMVLICSQVWLQLGLVAGWLPAMNALRSVMLPCLLAICNGICVGQPLLQLSRLFEGVLMQVMKSICPAYMHRV